MGKIKNERKIIVGGVENPTRDNVIIILQDIDDEEGHGVCIDSPGDGSCSFTTSFGYGPFAEVTAGILFDAAYNYYEHIYSAYTEPTPIQDIIIENEEFNDTWVKISTYSNPDSPHYGEIFEENTYTDGAQKLFAFMAKWGFQEK